VEDKYGKYDIKESEDCSWFDAAGFKREMTCYSYIWGNKSKRYLELEIRQTKFMNTSEPTKFYLRLRDKELSNRDEQIWREKERKRDEKKRKKALDDLKL
jgi:hypothetical protein